MVPTCPITDARSFPGGTLIFYRGLLDSAPSEAALIGVVGHELSHLDHGHQLAPLRHINQMNQSWTDGTAFSSPRDMMATIQKMVVGFAKPFRPEDESEADREAAQLLFFRTHPFHLDRCRAIQKQYVTLQRTSPKENLDIGKININQGIARSEREIAE